MKDYNIKKAKMIIWDLDETFWNGVLSEGEIKFKQEILDFIEDLTTKGIMNSICSKNDFIKAKLQFLNSGLKKYWDYFIFPSINWQPKGLRVKEIISNAGFREENIIFIDDNDSNINEVKYYCPQIMTAEPNELPKMIDELYLVNDYDLEHTRLEQYKILEKKFKDKQNKNISNAEFLKASSIKITINFDCEENIERIFNLIGRTNQLNFTKNRVSFDELKKQITNPNFESAYISVQDKYGTYGICGFYTIDKKQNKLIHFLFSCRILGMGIEQFIYSKLNFPNITILGEVAVFLKKDETPDWINIVDKFEAVSPRKKKIDDSVNILFKGPCDMLAVIDYINAECNVDTELPYWNKQLRYIVYHTHTAFIVQSHTKSKQELTKLSQEFPFPPIEEFKTAFFDKKYNLIFLSLLTMSHIGLYKNKENGDYAIFGYTNCDITDENNWENLLSIIPPEQKAQNLSMLREFKKKYRFAGDPPLEEIMSNLKYIRENLDSKTELVIILGSEIPTEKALKGYENTAPKHTKLNRAVEEFAKNYNNIDLVNLTQFIKSDDDYTNCIDHFSRRVYVDMAGTFVQIANKKLGKEYLSLNA